MLSTEMQWNRLVVNLWSKMSLFYSMKEGVSYLFLSATTYLLFCHVQPPPRSAVPHVCCRPSNGRKMQALTAVRYETDGRLANGWTDGLPENRLTGLGAGLPLTKSDRNHDTGKPSLTAEFNPTNPLEQGLGDRFFCLFKNISGLAHVAKGEHTIIHCNNRYTGGLP